MLGIGLRDEELVGLLETLRTEDSVRPLTTEAIRRRLGGPAVALLRREYFPRWRPDRVFYANASLRAFRRIVAEDGFERRVVEAVAPSDLEVAVILAGEEPETIGRTTAQLR